MSKIKETFLNNIPYEEELDGRLEYRINRRTKVPTKTRTITTPYYTYSFTWDESSDYNGAELVGREKERGLC